MRKSIKKLLGTILAVPLGMLTLILVMAGCQRNEGMEVPTSTPEITNTPMPTVTSIESSLFNRVISVEDIVIFGSYEQDGSSDNGAEPIEWLVLDIKDDKALLLSKNILEGDWWYHNYDAVWNTSSIREKLNSDFYAKAFSEEEKKQ